MARGKIKAKGKGNFIDFILDAQKDRQLAIEFLLYTDPNDLKNFFNVKGYAISMDEIVKILELRTILASKVSLHCIDDYY
ncbi:MAG: hypothetical protein KAV87_09155 [Desulfobacteraceae bacterium]|jgi:hypothetical protein|nr:hypothetical protein [Desulfobacteraceae bacterium]